MERRRKNVSLSQNFINDSSVVSYNPGDDIMTELGRKFQEIKS